MKMMFADYTFQYENNGDITFDKELKIEFLTRLGAKVFDSYVLTVTADDRVRLRKVDSGDDKNQLEFDI